MAGPLGILRFAQDDYGGRHSGAVWVHLARQPKIPIAAARLGDDMWVELRRPGDDNVGAARECGTASLSAVV